MAEPNSAPPPPPRKRLRFRLLLPSLVPVLLSLIPRLRRGASPKRPLVRSVRSRGGAPRASRRGERMSERVGEGLLPGPEDLAYDEENGFIYAGCDDGWIRRVKLEGGDGGEDRRLTVEAWVHVGGQPLGLALAPDGTVAVAHGHKGLLRVKTGQAVELLDNEAEGLKLGITDGVDVASDGSIYFTYTTYKYSMEMHMLDLLEARPHGRLMSFDPSANRTQSLLPQWGLALARSELSHILPDHFETMQKIPHSRREEGNDRQLHR